MRVLDPRQGPSVAGVSPAKRLDTFKGKTLGLLWNNKHGGDVLLNQVAEYLHKKYGLKEVIFRKKTFIGTGAPKEIIDDLVSKADAVVCSLGD